VVKQGFENFKKKLTRWAARGRGTTKNLGWRLSNAQRRRLLAGLKSLISREAREKAGRPPGPRVLKAREVRAERGRLYEPPELSIFDQELADSFKKLSKPR